MVSDGINGPLRGPVFCRSVLPHTIAVPGIYALAGYPVARLDVGLSTYRRVAAGTNEKLEMRNYYWCDKIALV